MDDIPVAVVYVGTGLAALFLCVMCHLAIRVSQGRARPGASRGGKGGESLAGEVNRIIEDLTLLAASPGRMASDPESDAVLRRVTELSLQQLDLAGPLSALVSRLRRARSAEESEVAFRELLQWMKTNRVALSSPSRNL